MRVLFLTNNYISLDLYHWLKQQEKEVVLYDKKLTPDFVKSLKPDFLISYNYRYIIKKEVLDFFNDNNAINLHISYLPWNRGAHPNIWSFIENTPKGVSIHLIDEGIDTGDILVQKEVFIDEERHTLKSSYLLLNQEIQSLFKENWERIKNGQIIPKPQKGKGSIHYKKDLEQFQEILKDNFDIPIKIFKEKVKNISRRDIP